MRKWDKKEHMKKANLLFEQRCNENKFSWNGEYANESEIVEDREEDDIKDAEKYNHDYNVKADINDKNYTDPYKIKEEDVVTTDEGTISLGDDLEVIEGVDCDCSLDEVDTTDVEKTKWFSDVDGERLMDKVFN